MTALKKPLEDSDHDTLIRVETRVNSILDEIRATRMQFSESTTDHETRIRVLEKDHNQYPLNVLDKRITELQTSETRSTINWKVVGVMVSFLTIMLGVAVTIIAAIIERHR